MSSQRYREFIAERERLLERIKELETENAELRKRLGEPVKPVSLVPKAMLNLSLQEKADLFRSLFKGLKTCLREDGTVRQVRKHGYQNDVLAFIDVCKSWNIPCSVERSRTGNGAHVWIFFDVHVLAVKTRRLGNAILTEAMNRNGKIGFKSYDLFFPNQDTMPEVIWLLCRYRETPVNKATACL